MIDWTLPGFYHRPAVVKPGGGNTDSNSEKLSTSSRQLKFLKFDFEALWCRCFTSCISRSVGWSPQKLGTATVFHLPQF